MTFSYAEKNVQASLDYARALVHAKDLSEVMRLHRAYIQAQMRSIAEQASEMGQMMSRTAMGAANQKADFLQSLDRAAVRLPGRCRPESKFYFMAMHPRFGCVAQNCHDNLLIT